MIKIIFCAFNEEKGITKFLTDLIYEVKLLEESFEIIICLDGSTDNSQKIIENFQNSCSIKILPVINQRGLGTAYKRLFLDILENSKDCDLIISLDADNTHNTDQIPEMLTHFRKNNLDLLIASRFCKRSVMEDFPIHRRFISKSTSILFQNLFKVKNISGESLKDFTSGYRIYSFKKLKELFLKEGNQFIEEPEFTYTCELLIKLSRINARFDEIDISYDYSKKVGESKLRIMRNFWRLIILLIKLAR